MSGRAAPAKPWERNAGVAGRTSTPLGPSSATDGQPKPWEQAAGSATLATPAGNSALTSSQPARPWERDGSFGATSPITSASPYSSGYGSSMYGGGGYGGANSRPMYGRGYGSGAYGSSYGSGSTYGASGYGTGAYGGSFGSSYGVMGGGYGGMGGAGYGSSYGGAGYGNYGSSYGGGYGGTGYGSQQYGSPYGRPAIAGPDGPFEPGQGPPQPPSAWQHMLAGLSGVVGFFGRLSFLVDENAHAIHFFISALLQLLDRAGSLYGEMARFVLRMLGYKGKPGKGKQAPEGASPLQHSQQPGLPNIPGQQPANQQALVGNSSTPWQPRSSHQLPAPSTAAARREPGWDSVWKTSD